MTAETRDLTIERHGPHVGVVCIRRGPNNYFDVSLIEGIASAYEGLATTEWCRAVVLAADGTHFCVGLDLTRDSGAEIAQIYRAAARLFAAPLPVVAAVQGSAVGGGCGLALSADFRVAAASTRFVLNFSRLGFHHGFAITVTLPALVGRQKAAELLLTGRRVTGDEALALGMCDRLVSSDLLHASALAYAAELAEAGPLAVRAIRATLRHGLVEDVRLAMDHEYTEQMKLVETFDFAEGVSAAAARRAPRFLGR